MSDVQIYSAPAREVIVYWKEDVFHSGSMPRAPRARQLSGELEKIFSYCARGYHLTAREILDYLDWRDGL